MKQSFRTKLKQLWVPKVFRLPEPEFTKDQVDLLEDLIQLIHPTLSMAETATKDDRVQMAHFLVDLGTGIWRIRRKIESLGRMPKEIRDALYSLESTWMSMSEGGVEIVDHIGTIPSKNEAKVVEVRDIPNLAREQVVDAVKPTILLKGEVIQLGEVVMGRPAKSAAPAAAPAEPVEPRSAFAPPVPEADTADQAALSDQISDQDEETASHEVETLSMELPARIEELSEEEAAETASGEAPLSEEAGEPTEPEKTPEMDAGLPEANEPGEAEAETESEPEPIEPETPAAEAVVAEAPDMIEPPLSGEADEPLADAPAAPIEAVPVEAAPVEVEEGFVRDVPTPFEQAISEEAAETDEKPKKKRTAKKAQPEMEKKPRKARKKTGGALGSEVAEAENDG